MGKKKQELFHKNYNFKIINPSNRFYNFDDNTKFFLPLKEANNH